MMLVGSLAKYYFKRTLVSVLCMDAQSSLKTAM